MVYNTSYLKTCGNSNTKTNKACFPLERIFYLLWRNCDYLALLSSSGL